MAVDSTFREKKATFGEETFLAMQKSNNIITQHALLSIIHLSRIVVIEIFSFFSSKTDFGFEFLVKTYVYAGNLSLIQ